MSTIEELEARALALSKSQEAMAKRLHDANTELAKRFSPWPRIRAMKKLCVLLWDLVDDDAARAALEQAMWEEPIGSDVGECPGGNLGRMIEEWRK